MPDETVPEEFWEEHTEHFVTANAMAILLHVIAPDLGDRLSIIGSIAEEALKDVEADNRLEATQFFARCLEEHIVDGLKSRARKRKARKS